MDKKTQKQLLKLVKKNYQEIAEEYDHTRRKPVTPLWKEAAKYIQEIKAEERILDAGCGNGKLLEFLPRGADYLGIDSSKELIDISKKRFPRYKFKVADILELDKLNIGEFDHIFCLAVLPHIPGEDLRIRALSQLSAKLKSDGRMLISAWNLWERKILREKIILFALSKLVGRHKMDWRDITFYWKSDVDSKRSKRYYHAFTKKELKRVIHKAGLTPRELYVDKHNYFAVITKA